jgi:hypothetical protein
MAKPRKPVAQPQGDPAPDRGEAAPPLEPLGEQLLREARESQAEFVAGWSEFMEKLGIQGKPVSARQLRQLVSRQAINPDDNEFSQGITAMREE